MIPADETSAEHPLSCEKSMRHWMDLITIKYYIAEAITFWSWVSLDLFMIRFTTIQCLIFNLFFNSKSIWGVGVYLKAIITPHNKNRPARKINMNISNIVRHVIEIVVDWTKGREKFKIWLLSLSIWGGRMCVYIFVKPYVVF